MFPFISLLHYSSTSNECVLPLNSLKKLDSSTWVKHNFIVNIITLNTTIKYLAETAISRDGLLIMLIRLNASNKESYKVTLQPLMYSLYSELATINICLEGRRLVINLLAALFCLTILRVFLRWESEIMVSICEVIKQHYWHVRYGTILWV